MIDEADTTQNGKVEFHEFIKMMPKNMQENFEKCKEREINKSSNNVKEEEEEEEDSESMIPAQKPTKR